MGASIYENLWGLSCKEGAKISPGTLDVLPTGRESNIPCDTGRNFKLYLFKKKAL